MAEEPPVAKRRNRARNADDIREPDGNHETEGAHEKRGGPSESERAHEVSERAHEVDALSYEQARSRLVEIVAQLEQGASPLEESLRLWERGEQLARHCQAWLDGARQRLNAAASAPDPRSEDDEARRAGAAFSNGSGTTRSNGSGTTRGEASDANANSFNVADPTPTGSKASPAGKDDARPIKEKPSNSAGKEKP